jgi:hypothetical protein
VYQNGQLLARKVVRVNDPLTVAGYIPRERLPAGPGHLEAPIGRLAPVGRTGRPDRHGRQRALHDDGHPGTPLGLQLELRTDARPASRRSSPSRTG